MDTIENRSLLQRYHHFLKDEDKTITTAHWKANRKLFERILEKNDGSIELSSSQRIKLETSMLRDLRPILNLQGKEFNPENADLQHWKTAFALELSHVHALFSSVGKLWCKWSSPGFVEPLRERLVGFGTLVAPRVLLAPRELLLYFDEEQTPLKNVQISVEFGSRKSSSPAQQFRVLRFLSLAEGYDFAFVELQGHHELPNPISKFTENLCPTIQKSRIPTLQISYLQRNPALHSPFYRQLLKESEGEQILSPGYCTQSFLQGLHREVLVCDHSSGSALPGAPVFEIKSKKMLGVQFSGKTFQASYIAPFWNMQPFWEQAIELSQRPVQSNTPSRRYEQEKPSTTPRETLEIISSSTKKPLKHMSREQLDQAYRKAINTYIDHPSIVGIDVGYKHEKDHRRPQLAIRFHVTQKKKLEELDEDDLFPREIEGVPTDVLERVYSAHSVEERQEERDPIQPGISISGEYAKTGTLGAIVYDNENKRHILSAWHILKGSKGNDNNKIAQPGEDDGGDLESDFAVVVDSFLDEDGDAAIARFHENFAREMTTEQFGSNVTLSGSRHFRLDETLEKSGRTTGVTQGVVTGFGAYKIDPEDSGKIYLINGFEISPTQNDDIICKPGDSGAIWYSKKDMKGVGLHIAGESNAIACCLKIVLERLNVTLREN